MELKSIRHRPSLLTPWGVLAFWVIVTAAFTWPLIINLSNTLPDWGDGADSAWRIGSIAHQLYSDPLHLYNTRAFYPLDNALTLDELLTGQGILGAPLIWLTDNPPLAFNLLVFLSFMLSGYSMWLLVRHLTGDSGAGLVAGLIFAFSPWHYGQYGHLGLAAQQWMIFALYFLIRFIQQSSLARPATTTTTRVIDLTGKFDKLKEFSRQNGLKFLFLFVLFFSIQAITAGYLAYFETILVGFYLTYYFIFGSGLTHWVKNKISKKDDLRHPLNDFVPVRTYTLLTQAVLLCGAGIIILALLIPFVAPFLSTQSHYDFKRDLTEINYWSASPNSLLRTLDRSWLYKPVERGLFHLQTSPERMLYPGLIAVVLVLVGLGVTFFRKGSKENEPLWKRQLPWLFILLSLSGLTLSLGPRLNLEAYGLQPTGLNLPYKWFYENVPGFNALRVPLRFGQLFMLGLAVCAGYGVAWLNNTLKLLGFLANIWQKINRSNVIINKPFNSKIRRIEKGLVITFLLILVGADFFAPGLPYQFTPTGLNAPPIYRWLASSEASNIIPDKALLLELPMGEGKSPVNTNPVCLMYGLSHNRRMLNGSANIIPPGYDRLFNEMQDFPSPRSLDIIEGLGVDYMVVHTRGLANKGSLDELDKQSGPGGRLKKVISFRDKQGNSYFRDIIFRVKKATSRFTRLQAVIPVNAQVLLTDDPDKRYLYTTALPGLIGPKRSYFSTYQTIYNKDIILPASPKQGTPYAVFYRGDNQKIAQLGYTVKDLIYSDPDNIIEVYHKTSVVRLGSGLTL